MSVCGPSGKKSLVKVKGTQNNVVDPAMCSRWNRVWCVSYFEPWNEDGDAIAQILRDRGYNVTVGWFGSITMTVG